MEGRTLLRIGVLVTCVAFTALGYRNANGDNSDAVAAATRAACAEPCSARLEQEARGSFGHEYGFQTERPVAGKQATAKVIVACQRELVLLGDWQCHLK
jgi:hypothetical protein